jgi:hypothetical protein
MVNDGFSWTREEGQPFLAPYPTRNNDISQSNVFG